MKILVPVKRVPDPYVPVRIDISGRDVVRENIPHAMNPFDEIALNEAARLKREHPAFVNEMIAVSIGPQEVQETLRTALAMGADRAIHILCEQPLEPLAIAKLLKLLVDEIRPDLVLMGKQSVDGDNGQTGPMLAGLIDRGLAGNAANIRLEHDTGPDEKQHIIVTREIDEGEDKIMLTLPAVITCDLRLNQPQPPGLAAVMKARQKTIEQRTPNDFAPDLTTHLQPRLEVLRCFEPPARPACAFLDETAELLPLFKREQA